MNKEVIQMSKSIKNVNEQPGLLIINYEREAQWKHQ